MQTRAEEYKYDVAISFAEEDRNAALALALALELQGLKKIYYYPDQQASTVGKPLYNELKKIYGKQTRYIVILLSKKYFQKLTAKIELEAIYKRIVAKPDTVCVIPVMLQKKLNISSYSILKELTYLQWTFNPKEIAELLKNKLGSKNPEDLAKYLSKKIKNSISIKQVNKAVSVKKQENNSIIRL